MSATKEKLKVSDYLAKRLSQHYKAEYFFMVSGGGAMHLNDSLGHQLKYICCHNEQAAAIAAEGYARVNGVLAVVNVTTGPGGLNALNGVFGQWTDSVPVLYISGQVKYSTTIASCPDLALRQLGDQEVDIISVVKPLVKYAQMVTDPTEIKYHLDRAVYEATTGRFGPVWLDIPMNVQAAMIDEDELRPFTVPAPPSYDLQTAVVSNKLETAQRPLIVAGHGLRLAGQTDNFLQLLDKLNVPVVTTFNGFDQLPTDHKNFIGRIGTIGQRAGNFALQNADMVLCLGTRNNIRQASYNYENFGKNAFKIVVDIDKAELAKPTVIPDLAVNADLAVFLPALQAQTKPVSRPEWLAWCQERKTQFNFDHASEYQQTKPQINVYYFLHKFSQHFKPNDICVLANGTAVVGFFQIGASRPGVRIFSNSGDASMGYDLPAAIGACVAGKGRKTFCLAGDGSIMMNLQELETIKHNNLPVKIFILSNGGYASIQQTQNNFFNGHRTGCCEQSGVSMPDFISIAEAFKIKAVKLENPAKIDTTIDAIINQDGPVICNVVVDPDYIFSPKLSSRKLDDGTMVSPSLEDMFPFLSREEYAANMITGLNCE